MNDEPDDLLPLLAPPAGTTANRAALLTATTAVLRRGRMIRQGSKALGMLAIFVLGGAAGWFLKPTPKPEIVEVAKVLETPPISIKVVPADIPQSPAACKA